MTSTLRKSAARAGLVQTQDGEGYFGYNQAVGTYIEVISYDKLLKNAKQRNMIFAGQIDAQIRFVRAVSLQRILVCDAAERCAGRDVILAVLGEDRRQHIFDDGKHVVLRGEGHSISS